MPPRTPLAALAITLALVTGCSREPRADSRVEQPGPQALAERAPDTVRVRFETSRGPFIVEAYREWSPHGVDRFYELTRTGYFDGVRFFRVLSGFMAQFGLHGDHPGVAASWRDRSIPDDPVTHANKRATVSFATRGPNTRTTQLFINYADNLKLDQMGFTPIGVVVEGMSVVDSLFSGYGEGAPEGQGPEQGRIAQAGNAYLEREFPKLDYIIKASVAPVR